MLPGKSSLSLLALSAQCVGARGTQLAAQPADPVAVSHAAYTDVHHRCIPPFLRRDRPERNNTGINRCGLCLMRVNRRRMRQAMQSRVLRDHLWGPRKA